MSPRSAIYREELLRRINFNYHQHRLDAVTDVHWRLVLAKWALAKYLRQYHERTGQQLAVELLHPLLGRRFTQEALLELNRFYACYPTTGLLTEGLRWGHYRELILLPGSTERAFYARLITSERWTIAQLRAQITGRLFYRAGREGNNQEPLYAAGRGRRIINVADELLSPEVTAFLDLRTPGEEE